MKNYSSLIFLAFFISFCLISCKKKEKPIVETTSLTNITSTTAAGGGKIISDGGDDILNRGVCWAKKINPTIDDNKTFDGNGLGDFSSTIEDLDPGTDYYVKAYATNSEGTGYGTVVSFKTLGQIPSASLNAAAGVTASSAQLAAIINPNYVSTEVSFEYGTTTSYGTSVSATQSPINGNNNVTVSANLSPLLPGTIYHYRVKAVNSVGTTYSNDLTFTTLGGVPAVTTFTSSDLTTSSVAVSASVNANHVSTTVSFEYGTSVNYGNSIPATQSAVTGSSSVPVSAIITTLEPGTTYHIRVKTENSIGITYSDGITVTTLGQTPTAITSPATKLFSNSTYLNGSVNANYLSTTVTFEYGTTVSLGSTISAAQNPITGKTPATVRATITGLTDGITYYFRVIAENELGVSYGDILTFVPVEAPASVTDIEGNVYSVVQIGDQYWMAENLKTTRYNDNTAIPNITDGAAWIALSSPGYCWYNNDAGYKDTYGALYNFYSVMTGKLCPTGWHVPGNTEFTTFTNYLGDINLAGGKIKETGTLHWDSPNTGATNETGFTALPAGNRNDDGTFSGIRLFEIWWTSTPYNELKPWYRSVGNTHSSVFVGNGSPNHRGFSVRCIKD